MTQQGDAFERYVTAGLDAWKVSLQIASTASANARRADLPRSDLSLARGGPALGGAGIF